MDGGNGGATDAADGGGAGVLSVVDDCAIRGSDDTTGLGVDSGKQTDKF